MDRLDPITPIRPSPYALSLLDDETAAAARATLGLGSAATTAAGAYDPAGSAAAAQAASQPSDADLTAIAALATTAYGRAFLALADAAEGRAALGLAARPAYTQTFATADKTHAARTAGATTATGATNITPYGYTQAQANEIVANLNALRADLADTAAVVNALVDDVQALGLAG